MDDAARENKIKKVTLVGSLVNIFLFFFKFVAGVLANSAAMVADAVHSLSDFITDFIVIVFVHVSSKPQDDDHDYGHGKYETFATFVIGVILLGVGIGIGYSAIKRIILVCQGDVLDSPGWLAFVAALLSIVLKELLYRYTINESKKVESQAMVANAWHHRSDALSSIGTAIGVGGAILLGNKWVILDPISAIVVSFFILKISFKLVKGCFGELTEQSLSNEIEQQIVEIVSSFPGVVEPHHLRTRCIGNKKAIEMHIYMDGNLSLKVTHDTTKAIESKLREQFGTDTHIALHVEPIKKLS